MADAAVVVAVGRFHRGAAAQSLTITGQRCPLCAWLLGMANDVIELTYELVMLDRLRDQGKITEEEHVQHRARILGEL